MNRLQVRRLLPRRVRVYPEEEVTTRAPDEASAQEGGLEQEAVDAIWKSVVNLYNTGLHPALSICVRRRGAVVLDRSIGHARGNDPKDPLDCEKVLATPDTLFNLFSASKAITAMLVLLAEERGLLSIDEPVASWIPAFGQKGKDQVTIRHVLTHRAGIPWIPGEQLDLDLLDNRARVLELICDLEPLSHAGQEAAYHALSGGFILAEIIRLASGRNIQTFLLEEVRNPLNMRHLHYGVPRPMMNRVASVSFTGPGPPRALERLLIRALGLDMEGLVEVANDERFLLGVVPAGNIFGTAREVGLFFELLLRGGALGQVRVFEEATIARAVRRQRDGHEIDRIIKLPIRYGLGFMLGSEHLSLYGRGTARTFGHLGFTNVIAYADRDRDISVALLNSGKPFVTPELLRWLNIMRIISLKMPRL